MSEPLLEIRNATLAYERKEVLTDVVLTLAAHDFCVLRGPNGGGKTTLLRLMAGLLPASSGVVRRKKGLVLGYLPQYRSIDRHFPITVAEVVRSGLGCRKPLFGRFSSEWQQQAQEVMNRLGIADLAQQPIEELSGGQWQRTLLARALVSRPELLLLDEPDTHLDIETKTLLYEVLDEESRRCAIVVVSHDEDLTSRFPQSRVLSVAGGKVVEATAFS